MSRLPIAAVLLVLCAAAAGAGGACAVESSHTITPLVESARSTTTTPTDAMRTAVMTPPKRTAADIAKSLVSAAQCADAADSLHELDRDKGFALFAACVTARNDFTSLRALLEGPWLDEMRTRTEAASLITRVIANRGGNIDHDLRLCRRAGLHLRTLRAVLAEPEELSGSLVIMRGVVVDARRAHGTRAVELSEMRLATNDDVVEDAELFKKSRHTDRAELSIETGLTLVARLPDSAGVLEPQLDYVMLLRFEGEHDAIRPGNPVDRRASLATILSTYEASSTLDR